MDRRHPCRHRWRCGKDNEDCQQGCWRSGRWNTAWIAGTPAGIGGDVEKTKKTASRGAGDPADGAQHGSPAPLPAVGGDMEKTMKTASRSAGGPADGTQPIKA
ncbi:MAG: hypothetical protein A2X45_24970 [Lentisphaerae bacterium GWF2_50_93]|nr:MAG: hypothetical protein A2X45_24970 [Lentisphaerae bacterium GWF2_50_93]